MKLKVATLIAVAAIALVGWVWKTTGSSEGTLQVAAGEALRGVERGADPEPKDVEPLEADGPERLGLATRVEPEVPVAETGAVVDGPAATSLTVRVVWRDQQPAEGVSLLVITSDKLRYRQSDRWVSTDAEGIAPVKGLAPGKYTIQADRGGSIKVELEPGEVKAETLVLEGAFDVHGTVRDGDGRTVAGAEVVAVTSRFDWRGAKRVATSDASGSFTVRCVDAKHSMGAFASGWAPSELVHLALVDADSVAEDHVVNVDLVLQEKGGDLWGTVVDPQGAPVEGVQVAVGTADPFGEVYSSGQYLAGPKPHTVRTDHEGRFRIDGVAAGVQPIAAWHSDWPIWRSEVEVVAGAEQRVDVALLQGVTVSGIVSRASGEPASGAAVIALAERFEDPFPNQGPFRQGSPFVHPRTEADADGRFALGPIAPGELYMYASLGTSALTDWTGEDPIYEGTCQETLSGAPGQELEWNPTLTLGLVISGVASYADGTPMKDVFVTAIQDKERVYAVTTNDRGEFSISGLESVPHRVTLQMPFNAPRTASIGAFYDVVPPVDDLAFVADYTPGPKEPRGKLRLRLRDTAKLGESLGKGPVLPVAYNVGTMSWNFLTDSKEGVLEEALRPGTYTLRLQAGEQVVYRGDPFEIRPGETLDLGTLDTEPLGTLEVTIERPEGVAGPVVVRRKYTYGEHQTIEAGATVAKFEESATGKFELEVTGYGIAKELVAVEVLPAIQNRVHVKLRRAAQIKIECTLEQTRGFRAISLTVKDAAGTKWYERFRREKDVREWPFSCVVNLPPGTYSIRGEASDGQAATVPVTVETDGGNRTIEVRLK